MGTQGRAKHDSRKGRESLSKRLGRVARQIKARDDHRCIYCGDTAEASAAPLHLDHVLPRSEGGTDTPDNLVLACRSCNCARKAMSLAQWSRYCAELQGCHPQTIARRVRRRLARALPELPRRRRAA